MIHEASYSSPLIEIPFCKKIMRRLYLETRRGCWPSSSRDRRTSHYLAGLRDYSYRDPYAEGTILRVELALLILLKLKGGIAEKISTIVFGMGFRDLSKDLGQRRRGRMACIY